MHDVDDSKATTKHKTKGKKGKVKKREWWTNSSLVRGSSFNAQKLFNFPQHLTFLFTLLSLSKNQETSKLEYRDKVCSLFQFAFSVDTTMVSSSTTISASTASKSRSLTPQRKITLKVKTQQVSFSLHFLKIAALRFQCCVFSFLKQKLLLCSCSCSIWLTFLKQKNIIFYAFFKLKEQWLQHFVLKNS